MSKKRGRDPRPENPSAPAEVVPTAAESWRRHVRIHELLEQVRDGRRRSRGRPATASPK